MIAAGEDAAEGEDEEEEQGGAEREAEGGARGVDVRR